MGQQHFGDKIFGKRRGGTHGLFPWLEEFPQEPFSPEKGRGRNKKGNPGSMEVVGSHQSWVWNMLAMGIQIMISDRPS